MDTFKKTLMRKWAWLLVCLSIVGFGLVGLFYIQGVAELSWWIVVSMLALYVFLAAFVFVRIVKKPFDVIMREIKAVLVGEKYNRIHTKRIDEFGIVAHFFNETVSALEKVKQDVKEGRRMSSELDVVREIQTNILPKEVPSIPQLDIIAKSRPAAEVGGDSFDFIESNGKHFVYIGDVTGHGAPAGMIMMMVNSLIHVFAEQLSTAKEILTHVNRILKPRIKTTMFMTLVMLEWDPQAAQMQYVGAGHENVLVYRGGQGVCEVNQSGGIALGMVDDNSSILEEHTITLSAGDVIVLYSDGVSEAKNAAGEQYGVDRLKAAVEKYAAIGDADTIFRNLAGDLAKFSGEETQLDDVTLIVARFTGQQGAQQKTVASTTEWASAAEV